MYFLLRTNEPVNMSLLWETSLSGTHYSVRRAGNSIRLYSNSVFHSQWNPQRPFAGAVWDCLSLPCLYQAPDECQRILLLGLGGGAGIRQIQTLIDFKHLHAIEIDPVHIKIAKRWFGINQKNVKVTEADAIKWLASYRAKGFDLVIDDLFGHSAAEPMRAQALTTQWVDTLAAALNPGGTLVVNCVSASELMAAVPIFAERGFIQGYRWSLPEYDNAIGVFFRHRVSSADWIRHLEATSLSPDMKRAARWVIRKPLALD